MIDRMQQLLNIFEMDDSSVNIYFISWPDVSYHDLFPSYFVKILKISSWTIHTVK